MYTQRARDTDLSRARKVAVQWERDQRRRAGRLIRFDVFKRRRAISFRVWPPFHSVLLFRRETVLRGRMPTLLSWPRFGLRVSRLAAPRRAALLSRRPCTRESENRCGRE